MKKLLSVLLVLSMVMALCVGCGNDTNTEENTETNNTEETANVDEDTTEVVEEVAPEDISGTITVITQRTDLLQEDAAVSMMDYAAKFNEVYPNVTVEFEGLTDYEGQIKIRMNTEEYGDVLMIPQENFTKEQLADFFEPLGTLAEMEKTYLWITDKEYEGNVYGIASVGNAQGILYNTEIFAAAGITSLPTSPEEFIADLELVKANTEAIPFYTNYAAGWPLGGQWESQAPSLGGDPEWQNSLAHTDEPWAEGQPYYVLAKLLNDVAVNELIEQDPTTTDWEACKGMIARGEIGTMVLGSWAISQIQEAAVLEGLDPSVIGYMPFPYTNADGNIYAAAGADYSLGVNVNSENKEAAKAWVEWFVNESGFTIDQGGISPVIGADMPATLQGFADLGVVYVANAPAPEGEESLLDDIDQESEIGRWSEAYRMRILEASLGLSGESFEEVIDDLNARWSAAKEVVEAN